MYPKKQSPSTSSRGEDHDGIMPIQPPHRNVSNREKDHERNQESIKHENKQISSSASKKQKQEDEQGDRGENNATKVAHGSYPINFEPVHPPKQSHDLPPEKQNQEDTMSDRGENKATQAARGSFPIHVEPDHPPMQTHDAPGAFAVQGQQIEHQDPGVISPHQEVDEQIDEANVTNLQSITAPSVAVDIPVAAELSPEPKSLETEILRILDKRAVVADPAVPQKPIAEESMGISKAVMNHPSIHACNKNRRLYVVVVLAIIIVVAIGLIIKVVTSSSDGRPESKEFKELQAFLANASFDSGEAIYNKDSPQYQAAMWIDNSRPYFDERHGYEKIQLYVLATLSFSTGGNTWLEDGSKECGWEATECDDFGRISKINLTDYELQGSIPPELGLLSDSLLQLYLRDNKLSGSCPPELGELTKLERLQLTNNSLTENIPTELGKLLNLIVLGLGINEFTGEIPKELGDLSSIITIGLERNQLSGNIPVELGQLQTMKNLFLDGNKLSGTIPNELSNLTKLGKIRFDNNDFTGSVPTSICALPFLKNLKKVGIDCAEVTCEINCCVCLERLGGMS